MSYLVVGRSLLERIACIDALRPVKAVILAHQVTSLRRYLVRSHRYHLCHRCLYGYQRRSLGK